MTPPLVGLDRAARELSPGLEAPLEARLQAGLAGPWQTRLLDQPALQASAAVATLGEIGIVVTADEAVATLAGVLGKPTLYIRLRDSDVALAASLPTVRILPEHDADAVMATLATLLPAAEPLTTAAAVAADNTVTVAAAPSAGLAETSETVVAEEPGAAAPEKLSAAMTAKPGRIGPQRPAAEAPRKALINGVARPKSKRPTKFGNQDETLRIKS